jgi:hypothetical protein
MQIILAVCDVKNQYETKSPKAGSVSTVYIDSILVILTIYVPYTAHVTL